MYPESFDTQTGESADHDAQGAVHGPQENLVPTPSAKEAPENVADGPSHAGKASADMGVGQAEHIDAAIGGPKIRKSVRFTFFPHEVTVTRASDKTVVCTQVTECELPIFVQPEVTIDTHYLVTCDGCAPHTLEGQTVYDRRRRGSDRRVVMQKKAKTMQGRQRRRRP